MNSLGRGLRIVFDTFCLMASICTISYCIYSYRLDEDSTSVKFKLFDRNSLDQGYPSFTVCFLDPFLKYKFKSYGKGINRHRYKKAAWGRSWDSRMNEIDYDSVTIDLNENIIFLQEWNEHFEPAVYLQNAVSSKTPKAQRHPFYVSHRCPWGKCFSQNLPYGDVVGIAKHDIWIDMGVFSNRSFPPGREEVDIWKYLKLKKGIDAFGIIFHTPNQLTRSIRLQSTAWNFNTEKIGAYKYHVLKFNIKSMQVLKRRNKRHIPCIEGITDDDEEFYNIAMSQIGCRPPFIKSSKNWPNCSSKEQLQEYLTKVGKRMAQGAVDDGHTTQPCISLELLDYHFEYNGYTSKDVPNLYPGEENLAGLLVNTSSAVKLEFNFPKRFQLMTQDKKYSLETLIGNAGTNQLSPRKIINLGLVYKFQTTKVHHRTFCFRWILGNISWILIGQSFSSNRKLV